MKKIISVSEAVLKSKELKKQGKVIVLVGGCFDILHLGHIYFLTESKKQGDVLFVLLESDEKIKKIKGEQRPVNTQKARAIVLSTLSPIDLIIPLSGVTNDAFYDKLIVQIEPDTIAVTSGDKNLEKRKLQADSIGAKLVEINKIEGLSTSKFIKNK